MAFFEQSVSMAAHATMEYIHAIAKQQLPCDRGMMSSMQYMPRCYKQDQLAVADRELLQFGHCELL
jgi:hypothetical protein